MGDPGCHFVQLGRRLHLQLFCWVVYHKHMVFGLVQGEYTLHRTSWQPILLSEGIGRRTRVRRQHSQIAGACLSVIP